MERTEKNFAKPINNLFLKVEGEDLPIRLDNFLKLKLPWRSRTFFQKMIEKGEVVVNNLKIRQGKSLALGDSVVLDVSNYQQDFVSPKSIPLEIIYEDKFLLVINKQPGIIVHPAGKTLYNTIQNAVHARFSDVKYKPRLVHRLDKETSGVLVLAKTEKVRTELAFQIENRKVSKVYRTITHGVFSQRTGVINLPLSPSTFSHNKIKNEVNFETGLKAHSEYFVEITAPVVPGFINGLSLVNVKILTGRTHQIRVHLLETGHPIIADKLYGREEKCKLGNIKIETHLLHAYKFACIHPETKKNIEFIAPLPPSFEKCVEYLKSM